MKPSTSPDNSKAERRPCEIEVYKSTGMPETDQLRSICDVLRAGEKAEDLSESDQDRLKRIFGKYKEGYPDDHEAQAVGLDDINAIGDFILRYIALHEEFMRLKRSSPEESDIHEVNAGRMYDVVRFMRERVQAATA